MEVIPFVLTEEAVRVVPRHLLEKLASCATDIILTKIKRYLSWDGRAADVSSEIEEIYNERLATDKLLSDQDLSKRLVALDLVDYFDVSSFTPIDTLLEWKELILFCFNEKNAVPYNEPIDGSAVNEVEAELKELVRITGDATMRECLKGLQKSKSMFRDPHYEYNRGTIFKSIVRNRRKFEVILYGIDFQLDMRKNGAGWNWRYL